jgi:hypothetical protein
MPRSWRTTGPGFQPVRDNHGPAVAAGTLAAGTGVLAVGLLAPAAASASSNQVWTGDGDGSSWTFSP